MDNNLEELFIPHRMLYEQWRTFSKKERVVMTVNVMKEHLHLQNCSEETEQKLLKVSSLFSMDLERMWNNCSRRSDVFEKKHSLWLQGNLRFCYNKSDEDVPMEVDPQPGPSRGRPRVSFSEASTKTKLRRIEELLAKYTPEELSFAAERANSQAPQQVPSEQKLSTDKALALYCDLNLSVEKYNLLRSVVNSMHKDCFPSYYTLLQAKNNFLPSKIIISETSAEVDLQELLNKTAESILKICNISLVTHTNLNLTCKWGFDGSSGHSLYKQTFEDTTATDEYMLLVALVPLRLTDVETKKVVWSNPRTSSTFYCRPIAFKFIKENPDVIRSVEHETQYLISNLQNFSVKISEKNLNISFEMLLTMFDGSVANILSDTCSTARCIICGATPKEMNTETVFQKIPNVSNYRFGLSTLHCWIRFFECLLHVAYRLNLKTWQVKGEENKKIFQCTKKQIQLDFRVKMGLIVDKPKPGYGSTNDGNTARTFFKNFELSSEITGINSNLIRQFSLILRVLSSGSKINIPNFKSLLDNSRKLYIDLYPWYYMPNTVHKILCHGCDIIGSFELPVGQLAEDALEARHKEFRYMRLHHTRKTSRIQSNTDLIRTLLITSDPKLADLRNNSRSNKKSLHWDTEIELYLDDNEFSESSLDE